MNNHKYAYFLGCQVPAKVNYCDLAVHGVTDILGIELVDLPGAGCCGCYLRSVNSKATIALSLRIMALTDRLNMNLAVLCNSCYATILESIDFAKENDDIMKETQELLAKEGLKFEGKTQVRDIIQIFYEDYGIEKISTYVKKRLDGLKVAVQYGCHLLRPSEKTKFDNPEDPHIFDDLVEITGAKSIYWPLKLWCCGFPTLPMDAKLSLGLARNKLKDAKDAGADCMVTTCPSCQISFDVLQHRISKLYDEKYNLPVLYYPQLLGLVMGLDPEKVGLKLNRTSADSILKFLK